MLTLDVGVGASTQEKRELLYCWTAQTFYVLVPKRRGIGFLKVPYGHHFVQGIDDVANAAQCDVFGLDGALEFECGRRVFYGGERVRAEFAALVMPLLEAHYGWPSREVAPADFWRVHPLAKADIQ